MSHLKTLAACAAIALTASPALADTPVAWKRYVSVDSVQTLSIAPDGRHFSLVSVDPSPEALRSVGPEPGSIRHDIVMPAQKPVTTEGDAADCSVRETVCVELVGMTLSLHKSLPLTIGGVWQSNGRRFQVETCARKRDAECLVYLISFDATIKNKGWFWFSEKRGVEMMALAGEGGSYKQVFLLASDVGLLR